MSDYSYNETMRRVAALREMDMSDDNWKMAPTHEAGHTIAEDKPSGRSPEEEPTYTVPVAAKAIRHLTQSYEKLENQILKLAETMARVPVLERKMMMTEHRFKNIIKEGINTTMINSDAAKEVVTQICMKANEQIYVDQNTIVRRLNELTAEMAEIKQRIERIERGHGT